MHAKEASGISPLLPLPAIIMGHTLCGEHELE